MMNPDDLEPARPVFKSPDLQPMSVAELNIYIMSLEAEIRRASDMIAKKNAHRSGIDALFGSTTDDG